MLLILFVVVVAMVLFKFAVGFSSFWRWVFFATTMFEVFVYRYRFGSLWGSVWRNVNMSMMILESCHRKICRYEVDNKRRVLDFWFPAVYFRFRPNRSRLKSILILNYLMYQQRRTEAELLFYENVKIFFNCKINIFLKKIIIFHFKVS